MMKEVTDKKYKLQIEEKLWSDQYPAAINCFGLLLGRALQKKVYESILAAKYW